MRQAGGAEHQREAQGKCVERIGDELARSKHLCTELIGGCGKELQGVAAEPHEDEAGKDGGAREEQRCLHDLNPGRGEHPAKEDIRDHHGPHDDDRQLIGEPEEQLHQVPRPDHLSDQVKPHHREGADRRRHPDGALPQAIGHDIGEGVFAEISERLGDQEHDHGPANQESDGVDEPVKSGQRHETRDAEEAGGAHVIPGQGEAVLDTGHRPSGGIEMLGALGLARSPPGDAQGHRHEREEAGDRNVVGFAETRRHRRSSARVESTCPRNEATVVS